LDNRIFLGGSARLCAAGELRPPGGLMILPPAARKDDESDVPQVGDVVRVTTRSGRVIEGEFQQSWPLRTGGLAVSLRFASGGIRGCTTLLPILILQAAALGRVEPAID
jgi:hypothetical protein